MKEELHICICASKDNFGAYSENCQGIFGAGNTVEDCKKDVLKSIEEIKSYMPREEWPAPLRGEYEIVWEYDVKACFAITALSCHSRAWSALLEYIKNNFGRICTVEACRALSSVKR